MPAADYAFDPGATNASNVITNEQIAVNPAVDRSVWPQHGPFFAAPDKFTLRGRNTVGSGTWRVLVPNLDFTFSPQFTKASAAAGSTICTYVVLIDSAIAEVQYDYRALGQYEDDHLNGWFANNVINRSVLLEWLAVVGDTAGTNPLTRHGELQDLSASEVLNRGLEMIRDAIRNPFTTTVMNAADMTRLEAGIASAATQAYVDEFYQRPQGSFNVLAGTATVLYTMSAEAYATQSVVTFKASADNDVQMKQVSVVTDGTSESHTTAPELETDGNLFSVTTQRVGTVVQILGTAIVDGTFNINVVAEHRG